MHVSNAQSVTQHLISLLVWSRRLDWGG